MFASFTTGVSMVFALYCVRLASSHLFASLPERLPTLLRAFFMVEVVGIDTVNSSLSCSNSWLCLELLTRMVNTGLPHSKPILPQLMVLTLTSSPFFTVRNAPCLCRYLMLLSRYLINSTAIILSLQISFCLYYTA